jgi:3'(2'), 5'-bisphosphate nucleotidase
LVEDRVEDGSVEDGSVEDGSVESGDEDLAARLAEDAGRLLMELRSEFDGDKASLAKAGDKRSHEHLIGELSRLRPADAIVSEEDDESKRPWPRPSRQWVVDPLDGTREYSEKRADFAVHVALVIDGSARVGAVALPGEGLILSTGSEPPPSLAERAAGPVRMLVSRTRPPREAEAVAEILSAELVPMGSAGAKSMAVVRGIGDAYLHSGGQYEWDSAAPVAVAVAAGAHASRLDGSPIRYGRRDAWLPDLLICRPELAERILEALATVQ